MTQKSNDVWKAFEEVADFGKIKLQLKNKYDAKRERE